MNYTGLSEIDALRVILSKIDTMQVDMGALLQAQQISNFLSLANNMQVPEDVRALALNRAMEMMGLNQSRAAEQFNNEALPTDLIR